MFTVKIIETGYDAFSESEGPEIARILRKLADKVEGQILTLSDGYDINSGSLLDINGNRVGSWEWSA